MPKSDRAPFSVVEWGMEHSDYTVNVSAQEALALLQKGEKILAENDRAEGMGGISCLLEGPDDIRNFLHFEEHNLAAFGRDFVHYYVREEAR